MKFCSVFLLCFLFVPFSIYAEKTSAEYWNEMSVRTKVYFLEGFVWGIAFTEKDITEFGKLKIITDSDSIKLENHFSSITKIFFAEERLFWIEKIDNYYQIKDNEKISFSNAIWNIFVYYKTNSNK